MKIYFWKPRKKAHVRKDRNQRQDWVWTAAAAHMRPDPSGAVPVSEIRSAARPPVTPVESQNCICWMHFVDGSKIPTDTISFWSRIRMKRHKGLFFSFCSLDESGVCMLFVLSTRRHPILLQGTLVNRTYGTHKNLPGICVTIFTNNIWSC